MRSATFSLLVLVASCRSQHAAVTTHASVPDSETVGDIAPHDSADSALLAPRVITGPTVLVFWLSGADTLTAADQAEALDELNSTTESIVGTLKQHNILLLPTNSDTIYVALPNRQRRLILLDGLDYPFGYVLIEPGTAERILAGLYADDELLDEVEAYFDLPPGSDSTSTRRRVAT